MSYRKQFLLNNDKINRATMNDQIYKIALLGRPNVGKSTIFNKLIGERKAIVDPFSGITRDRVSHIVTKESKTYELIDAGGYFENPEGILEESLLSQLNKAINDADLLIIVLDSQMGPHPMDRQIIDNVRLLKKEMLFVANKSDNPTLQNQAFEFMSCGIDQIHPISALHKRGLKELETMILSFVPDNTYESKDRFGIAFVGKPNVGKSSIVNKILNDERMIVSEIPGTTRDSVDIDFEYKDHSLTLIDTAGLTRRSRLKASVDAYSIMRTKDAIERSKLVVMMVDAGRNIESQDIRIARQICKAGRILLIVVNKWDLVKKVKQEHYTRYLLERIPFATFCKVIYTSIHKKKNLDQLLKEIIRLKLTAYKRIPTSTLNEVIKISMQHNCPPFVRGKRLKVYYATQISDAPPTFTLFVNSSKCAADHYIKYLENKLRDYFQFEGMPIRIKLKNKRSSEEER